MPDKFDLQNFINKEREQTGELRSKIPWTKKLRGELFIEHADFGQFTLEVEKKDIQNPCQKLFLKSEKGSADLLAKLPVGYTVDLGFYVIARIKRQSKQIEAPRPMTKGALISLLHEIGHAIRDSRLEENEREKLIEAAIAKNDGKGLTDEQRSVIMSDEKEAWMIVERELIKEINKELGTSIVDNQDELENYTKDRIDTYEKHL